MSTILQRVSGIGRKDVPAAEVVTTFLDAISQGEVVAALDLLSPDVRLRIEPADLSGGYEEAQDFLRQAATAFPDLMLPVRSLAELAGGRVVAEVTFEGTQAADFLGVLNQGKHIDIEQGWLFEVAGGRVAALTAYWDQNQLYRRLGVKRLDQIGIAS